MTHLTLLLLAFTLPAFISPTMHFRTTLRPLDHKIQNVTKTERLRLALGRTRQRLQRLQGASNHHTINIESPITYYGHPLGEYLMDLAMGTPPVSFSAVMGTGAGLSWIQCAPCKACTRQSTPIFNPTKSSSYRTLRCPNAKCKIYNPDICKKQPCGNKCTYNFTYEDGTGSSGDLATETLWFEANTIPIEGVLIGCGFSDPGELYGSAGTVGLGGFKDSFTSQLNISVFSYCLPSVTLNGTGRFFMGCDASAPPGALTTPLLKNPRYSNSLHYLNLQGITIGGVSVPINTSAFAFTEDGLGGMVIDSGTSVTILERSTFEAVVREFSSHVRLPRVVDPDFKLCYKMSRRDLARTQFPKFVFRFKGADLELARNNYLYFDEEKGTVCLAMLAADNPDFSTFGSYQQQDTLVVYDLANHKLSFVTNTNCENI